MPYAVVLTVSLLLALDISDSNRLLPAISGHHPHLPPHPLHAMHHLAAGGVSARNGNGGIKSAPTAPSSGLSSHHASSSSSSGTTSDQPRLTSGSLQLSKPGPNHDPTQQQKKHPLLKTSPAKPLATTTTPLPSSAGVSNAKER